MFRNHIYIYIYIYIYRYYYYYYFFLNKIIKQKHNILEEDKDEEGIKCKKKNLVVFCCFLDKTRK